MIRNIYSLTTKYGDLHVGECTSSNKGNARNYICKVFYAMRGRDREIMRNVIVYIPNEVFEGVAVFPVVMRISKHDGNTITNNKFVKVTSIRYLGQMETKESRDQNEINRYKQDWKSSWQNVMDEMVPQGQPRDLQRWRRNKKGEWVRIETLPDRPRVVRSNSPPMSIPQAPPLVSGSRSSSSSSSKSPHYLESMAEQESGSESRRSYPEGYEVKNPAVYELTESRKSREYRKNRESMLEKAERDARNRAREQALAIEKEREHRERRERIERDRLERERLKKEREQDMNRRSKEDREREEKRRRQEQERRKRRESEERKLKEDAEKEYRKQERLLQREREKLSKPSSEPVEYDYKHNDNSETGTGQYIDVRRREVSIPREVRHREHEQKQKRDTEYEKAYKEEYSQAYKEAYARARANVDHKTQVNRFLDEDRPARPVRPVRNRVNIEDTKRSWWRRT